MIHPGSKKLYTVVVFIGRLRHCTHVRMDNLPLGRHGAFAQLKGQSVQVIITDLNMPVMDGITMIRRIRALPQYKFPPILMLTTESQASTKQTGKQAGATGWIVKPLDPQKLMAVIAKVVR